MQAGWQLMVRLANLAARPGWPLIRVGPPGAAAGRCGRTWLIPRYHPGEASAHLIADALDHRPGQSTREIAVGIALAMIPWVDRPDIRPRPTENIYLGGDDPGPRRVEPQAPLYGGGNLHRAPGIAGRRVGDWCNHDGQRVTDPPGGEHYGAGPVLRPFLASSLLLRSPQVGVANDKARLGVGKGHRLVTRPIRGRSGR